MKQEKNSIVNLRPHHLLCVFGWQGHGYSEEFNEAMDKVADLFKYSKYNLLIQSGPDELCGKCPHLRNGSCFKDGEEKEEVIKLHDKRVIDFLGFKDGQEIIVGQLKKAIAKNRPHENLKLLCEGCQWLKEDYCFKGLKLVSRE